MIGKTHSEFLSGFFCLEEYILLMNYCPYCGQSLDMPLLNGISTCNRCKRVFDTSDRNRLLSAAWLVRREHTYNIEIVEFRTDLSPQELSLIYEYVIDLGYCHDDFLKILDSLSFDNAA